MELKVLLYIIAGIIYLFFSFNKGKKKREENEQKPVNTGKKSWEDELQDILRKTMQGTEPIPTPAPVPERIPAPVPVNHKKPKTVFLDEEMSGYTRQKQQDEKNHFEQENYSIEFDSSPVFAHAINEEGMVSSSEKPASVGARMLAEEPFDGRKAFLYSEIFNRKY